MHRAEERNRRGYALDSPTVKRLQHASKKNEPIPTGESGWTCTEIPCARPLVAIRVIHLSLARLCFDDGARHEHDSNVL